MSDRFPAVISSARRSGTGRQC